MAPEDCAVCGQTVPLDSTVHVLVNPSPADGIEDHYVCRRCYASHLGDALDRSATPE